MSTESLAADDASVETFYNPYHDRAGRFTFKKGGKRGKIYVPFSENSRRSYAIMRSYNAAKKSKEYKTAQERARGSWADREKGQGGLRHVKGTSSKKADAARAANAKTGANTKRWNTDPQLKAIKAKYDPDNPSPAALAARRRRADQKMDAWKRAAAAEPTQVGGNKLIGYG